MSRSENILNGLKIF